MRHINFKSHKIYPIYHKFIFSLIFFYYLFYKKKMIKKLNLWLKKLLIGSTFSEYRYMIVSIHFEYTNHFVLEKVKVEDLQTKKQSLPSWSGD